MKQQNLKKILFFSILFCSLSSLSKGQMIDLMGSMAVGGVQTVESVKGVGQMNRAMHANQVLEQIQFKIVDISTTYFGNYRRLKPQTVTAGNTKINFKPVNNGANYEAYISPLTPDLCFNLINSRFDNVVSYRLVNNGSSKEYTPTKIQGKADLCNNASAIALIFQ